MAEQVTEYDGAVWPSEAALHLELLRPPSDDAPASRVRVGAAEVMLRQLRMSRVACSSWRVARSV